jgi:P27 family predicted phage terminase small subunit
MTPTTKAPRHLTTSTRAWWEHVNAIYVLTEHHRMLLTLAAEAWDRSVQAREQLKADGIVYTDRFGAPRKHPAVSIEEQARSGFARLMRELDLDGSPTPDVRTPRARGVR